MIAWSIASLTPAFVWAQGGLQPQSELGWKRPTAVSTTSLTQDQVESFAAMVGDSDYVVAQVLAYHPDLVPAALGATTARSGRKRSGKSLIIAGFSVLGAGLVGGFLVALSAPLICFDEACKERQQTASNAGGVIAIGGAALGLALALPGFIKSARESDTEVEAIHQYRTVHPETVLPPPRTPVRSPAMSLSPGSFTLPLLSMTF